MGSAPSIVCTRANIKVESQSNNKKLIVTDTAAGQLKMKQHTVIKEHTDQVNCVAMSPKGILASSGNDGEIVLYDTHAQKPLAIREDASNLVYSLCFSPTDEGRHLITASFDKSVRLFNIAAFSHPDEHVGDTQKSKRLCSLLGHTKSIGCVAYSPDAHYIATGSDDESVIIWDMARVMKTKVREIVFQLPHPGPVYAVAFSADSKTVFTAAKDQTIRCYSCETGKILFVMNDPKSYPASSPLRRHAPLTLSSSPDGTMLASGSLDNSIILWDLTLNPPQPKFSSSLRGHTAAVRSVSFSNNSSFLVSGSEDATIRVWKILNGDENDHGIPSFSCIAGPILAGTDRVNSVCWSPDNNFVVSASYDSTVRVFTFECPGVVVNNIDVKNPELIKKFEFNEDGTMILAKDAAMNVIEKWWTTPRTEIRVENKKKKEAEAKAALISASKKKNLGPNKGQQQIAVENSSDSDDDGDPNETPEQKKERKRREEEARRNNRAFQVAAGGGFFGCETHEENVDENMTEEEKEEQRKKNALADEVAAKFGFDDDEDDA